MSVRVLVFKSTVLAYRSGSVCSFVRFVGLVVNKNTVLALRNSAFICSAVPLFLVQSSAVPMFLVQSSAVPLFRG